MTIPQLAAFLEVPVSTIYNWRHQGRGPRAYKIGAHVRYRCSEVQKWLEEQAEASVGQPA